MITETDLHTWQTLAKQLSLLKKQETALRRLIVQEVMKGKTHGTEHLFIEDSEAVAVINLNYSVKKDDLLSIQKEMAEEEKACIEWKPSISVKAYKKLIAGRMLQNAALDTPLEPLALQKIITIKPTTPSLTVNLLEPIE